MKKALILTLAATSLIAMTVTDAFAWEHNGTVTGPRGYSRSLTGSGSCSDGSCSSSRQVTGPRGNTRTHEGTISRTENGWQRNGTVTGPNDSATYQGSGSCSGGNCTYGGSRTGPYGTTTHSGSISR
jgi:hypothetical protein